MVLIQFLSICKSLKNAKGGIYACESIQEHRPLVRKSLTLFLLISLSLCTALRELEQDSVRNTYKQIARELLERENHEVVQSTPDLRQELPPMDVQEQDKWSM